MQVDISVMSRQRRKLELANTASLTRMKNMLLLRR